MLGCSSMIGVKPTEAVFEPRIASRNRADYLVKIKLGEKEPGWREDQGFQANRPPVSADVS